jgi:hypothetical protein
MWLSLSALIENWLLEVELEGRYAGSCNYNEESTRTHEI